ncbi:alpha/beta fold hydrolase [Aeromicrobium wangtongii]|uniref:Alpha/beta hydrolase n=1 Tax=Aeromicrobium wangtongii TaxID=2969247 RepID=A0ABY5MAK6_9ACTN|nr:alpha/beta hydrolase [Aeromicrobium wangtongii]MCD9197681.1 alpha/beta hydrolase [Aeromicrobium wangtongii]UUP15165.1 alpha/beta hydrolase [Aeromicrobium wangtongii]
MNNPTIVLVHGAFADAASWSPVTRALLDNGHRVIVPPNHLRTLSGDAASVRRVVEAVDGPVVLAGHSYGGAVITVAGAAENVVGLVYVAAYVPDKGESPAHMDARYPATDLRDHLVTLPNPSPGHDEGVDLSVEPSAFLPVFAAGLDPRTAEVLAVSQRSFADAAYTEEASAAAWKSTPSWGIVATADKTVQPDVQRFGYERAGFKQIVEVDAPHLAMQTNPKDVVDLLEAVVSAVGRPA